MVGFGASSISLSPIINVYTNYANIDIENCMVLS